MVEAIVTTLVALVLAGAAISLFIINNRAVSNGALNTKLLMQYETVIEQIGTMTRNAVYICDDATCPPLAHAVPTTTNIIYLFDINNVQVGGYWLDGSALKEWKTGSWVPFTVGPNAVLVTTVAPNISNFIVSQDRKSVTLNVSVWTSFGSLKDTSVSNQETFMSRK
jgi:hypothetical protein